MGGDCPSMSPDGSSTTDASRPGHSLPRAGISLVEGRPLPLLDMLGNAAHAGNKVADQPLPRIRSHQPIQSAGLRVVVTVVAVVVPRNRAVYLLRPLGVLVVFHRTAKAVRLVVRSLAAIVIKTHRAVAMIR